MFPGEAIISVRSSSTEQGRQLIVIKNKSHNQEKELTS